MRILGVDPGSKRIGYGLLTSEGGSLRAVEWGTLEIRGKLGGELKTLGEAFRSLVTRLKPECAAVERLYFAKNKKTALAVSEARGVLCFILLERGIPLCELHPMEIKQSVTNYGLSDKRAVAKMVGKILGLDEVGEYDDASDALAAAITASSLRRFG